MITVGHWTEYKYSYMCQNLKGRAILTISHLYPTVPSPRNMSGWNVKFLVLVISGISYKRENIFFSDRHPYLLLLCISSHLGDTDHHWRLEISDEYRNSHMYFMKFRGSIFYVNMKRNSPLYKKSPHWRQLQTNWKFRFTNHTTLAFSQMLFRREVFCYTSFIR